MRPIIASGGAWSPHMNKVLTRVIRSNGSVEERIHENLRTNAGVNWQADHMGSASIAPIQNIALTEDTTTPASGMTNLVGELAADGLSRKTATYAHTADASTYTQSASWQYTGASTVTVARAALAYGATDLDTSADTHFLITAVSPVAVLTSNDTLEVDWGISI